MLRILLVEDEYLVLKGMEMLLKTQEEVELTVRTAMDAGRALEEVQDWNPDVVISDINMPETDGLSLLEGIAQIYPQCKFIVISGYDEHDYMKRALKLHVHDYLLKPVDKVYLFGRLAEFDREKRQRLDNALMKMELLLIKRQELNLAQEWKELFPSPWLSLMVADLSGEEAQSLKEALLGYMNQVYVLHRNRWSILLLNCSVCVKDDELRGFLIHALPRGCAFGLIGKMRECVGEEIERGLFLWYQEALCDMVLSLLPVSRQERDRTVQRIMGRTLQHAICMITHELSASEYANTVWDSDKDPMENYRLALTEITAAHIMTVGLHLEPDRIASLYEIDPETIQNAETLACFLSKIQNPGSRLYAQTEQSGYSVKVSAACAFIAERFREDISLEQTAEYVDINPSYLSAVFKKETGVNFMQYLTDIRMQCACGLMMDEPNLLLDDVAERVGYHSASYFSRIFRSRFGMSPRNWLQERMKQK